MNQCTTALRVLAMGLAGAGAMAFAAESAGAAVTLARYELESGTAGALVTTDGNDAAAISGVIVSDFVTNGIWRQDDDQAELTPGSLDNDFWVASAGDIGNLAPDGKTFTFTITPEAGTAIVLDEIRFHMGVRRDASELGGRTNGNWTAKTSITIDNVTTEVGNLVSPTSTGAETTHYEFASLDLATATGGAEITLPITFLFEYFDNTSQGDKRFMLDDVELTGTVVPEPAALSLLVGAGTLLLGRRRH